MRSLPFNMILAIVILLYVIGIIITYIVTRTRAEWAKEHKNKGSLFGDDQDTGVIVFTLLSFLGLVLFVLFRCIDMLFKTIDKLMFNDK